MRNPWFLGTLALWVLGAAGAEHVFDFGEVPEGQAPPGFRSAVMGAGKPGDWRILLDEVPPLLERLTPQTRVVSRRPVLAQLSHDPTDERFPMLVFDGDTYDDFTLTTHFKTVSGTNEQMAGIVFRLQNETNYYVVRASSLGSTLRFYKVVNGERGKFFDGHLTIQSNIWHELKLTCKGSQIHYWLDGQPSLQVINDTTFTSGKIGFWTKSDAVSYFADTRIEYKSRVAPAEALVQATLKKFPKLLGLKLFVQGAGTNSTVLAGSNDPKELGQAGGKTEGEVLRQGTMFFAKDKDYVAVIAPLRDRNGEPIAAVRVVMTTFLGQTDDNAVTRAMPVIKEMQSRVLNLQDLVEQ